VATGVYVMTDRPWTGTGGEPSWRDLAPDDPEVEEEARLHWHGYACGVDLALEYRLPQTASDLWFDRPEAEVIYVLDGMEASARRHGTWDRDRAIVLAATWRTWLDAHVAWDYEVVP
jgi:hypothetical protein